MKMQAAALRFAIAIVLAGLAGCAGELDPSLLPGGSGNPLGQAGSGGTMVCDAPKMVFAPSCAITGCHAPNTAGGAGLDLGSAGVVGRLLGQGPSTNSPAGAVCTSAAKPYLVVNSNPPTGLLMDKMDANKTTCGSTMSVLAQLSASQLTCLSAWATAVTTGVITQ
jgi:hypothetical protein